MDEQQKQTVLDLPKVIAVGIASPAGAALTSRFGVAGTLLGLALSAVIITVVSDLLKVYLARISEVVTIIPGGFRKKPALRRFVHRIGLPSYKFAALPPARRRSILMRSVIAGGISFLVGLIIVTSLELGVGKSLSCWVWNECPEAVASSSDGQASTTSTLPSILGGGSSVRIDTPQVTPSNPQPTASSPPSTSPDASPTSPSPPPASSGSEMPNPSSPRSSYQQESSSSTSESEQSTSEEYQQQPEYQQHSEYTQSTGKSGRGQPEAPPPLHWFTT